MVGTPFGTDGHITAAQAGKLSGESKRQKSNKIKALEEGFKQLINDGDSLEVSLAKTIITDALINGDKDMKKYLHDHIHGKAKQEVETKIEAKIENSNQLNGLSLKQLDKIQEIVEKG